MEKKKTDSPLKLVKIKDAINLVYHQVNLLGKVLERREPKLRTNDVGIFNMSAWICTLRIMDDSYPRAELTVNVFSNTEEELPRVKNQDDMILLVSVQMRAYGGNGVNASCDIQQGSSFALFEMGTGKLFVRYQCTSNFQDREEFKCYIDTLGKFFGKSCRVDQVLPSASSVDIFSFLREIKEGLCFNLVCKILHVDEDMNAIFVWDGTDAPPANILANENEDKSLSSLSVHSLLSRDILLGFPTVGTILRVSLSIHLSRWVKAGEWVKLYHLLCEVDRGSWIGKATVSTKVDLAQDELLVEKVTRIYDKRISSKFGHIPYWSFPSPPGLTETDDDGAPLVTLMDIITCLKVAYKYKCIVRAVAANPSQLEDFCSEENGYRVLLTLEDPTATLDAVLCDKDAEYFWGSGLHHARMMRKKWNRLLGIRGSSKCVASRNPPWIECYIFAYCTQKADPLKNRFYRIFGTRFLD